MRPNYLILLFVGLLSACSSLSVQQKQRAQEIAQTIQDQDIGCYADQPCGIESPLYTLATANMKPLADGQIKHSVILLDQGHDALLIRLHMIESAKHSIDMQSFIFETDEAGALMLDALIRAAKRGIKVRILLDQLYGLTRPELQAVLAAAHKNFEIKLYSPMFNKSKTSKAEFFAGIVFAFKNINSRMHTKLLLVDDRMAIVGGRNIDDRYFDWGAQYNYRDRDVWIAGPITEKMRLNFEAFWSDTRSQTAIQLDDVAQYILRSADHPEQLALPRKQFSERMQTMKAMAQDGQKVLQEVSPYLRDVQQVRFYADLPEKHSDAASSRARASNAIYQMIAQAQDSIFLQTPYLVMSRMARQTFRSIQHRAKPVKVWVSTNSLAATDAFPVYALSHKYKRLYLRELGFRIYEFKPFPESAFMRVGQTVGWAQDVQDQTHRPHLFAYAGSISTAPVPLHHDGMRVGMHAKSMVIDQHVSVIGSHNFDPRSDEYNTESMLVIDDPEFARLLTASIVNDMRSENAWVIAPRKSLPAIADFNYTMGKWSEKLPLFDIWPWPYATSYQLRPECWDVAYDDPRFDQCAQAVGDFPEVNMSLKGIYTRIITAFGAGLEPIL